MNIKEIKNEEKNKKCFKLSYESLNKLKKNLKTTTLIVVGGVLITSLVGCSSCNTDKIEENSEVIMSEIEFEGEIELESNEEETIDADQKIYTLQDDATFAANDALRVGIDLSYDGNVDQNDIDTYAKQFTNYLIVVNRNNYDDKLFAEMMIGSNVSSEDLIQSFMDLNTAFKKHIITVTNNNLYDFNNLYDENEAEILNHAQSLIATMNENKLDSEERKEAAKEFYTYSTGIINSTNARMAISPEALDTLVTFIEAYDELTFNYKSKKIKGAYVDDELEHALNISKDSCFGVVTDSKLNVEDKVVLNFKSLFRTHILKELNDKYEAAKDERALQLQLGNTLNEMNSYNSIINYVKEHIKIELYKPLNIDYQAWLKELKGLNIKTSQQVTTGKNVQNYSGISDGHGGIISSQQLQKYGIITTGKTSEQVRNELEKAVQDEENKKSEQNKVVTKTDQTGKQITPDTTLSGTTQDAQNGYSAGYADGQKFSYNCPSNASDAYKTAYNNGYSAGQDNAKKMQEKFSGSQETYESVQNGSTTTEETIKTEDYTQTTTTTQNTQTTTVTTNPTTTQNTQTTTIENHIYTNSNDEIINKLPEVGETFEPVDEEIIEEFEIIEDYEVVDEYEIIETLSCASKNNLKEELINYRNILLNLNEKTIEPTHNFKI